MVGLAWSNDPESYAAGSVASGSASHARQVKDENSDRKGYPGLPDLLSDVGLTTARSVEKLLKLRRSQNPPRTVMPDEEEVDTG
jgi:hypothetical protein